MANFFSLFLNFINHLPFCHQLLEMPLFKGYTEWWQIGGRMAQERLLFPFFAWETSFFSLRKQYKKPL